MERNLIDMILSSKPEVRFDAPSDDEIKSHIYHTKRASGLTSITLAFGSPESECRCGISHCSGMCNESDPPEYLPPTEY